MTVLGKILFPAAEINDAEKIVPSKRSHTCLRDVKDIDMPVEGTELDTESMALLRAGGQEQDPSEAEDVGCLEAVMAWATRLWGTGSTQ